MPDISHRKIKPKAISKAFNKSTSTEYAELQVTSNFSFLTGASHPEELVSQAALLNYKAIAITDCNSLAGVVRGHLAAKEAGISYIVGARIEVIYETLLPQKSEDYPKISILAYPVSRIGYGNLCQLLTLGKRRTTKDKCFLTLHDFLQLQSDLAVVLLPPTLQDCTTVTSNIEEQNFLELCKTVRESVACKDYLSIALTRNYGINNTNQANAIIQLANFLNIPLVATNDVYYHLPERHILQNVLSCIKNKCTISQAGFKLFSNAERYLKPVAELKRLFKDLPQALRRTLEIAEMLDGFSLDHLRYEYPDEILPKNKNASEYLAQCTWKGVRKRYPKGVPAKVTRLIKQELELIAELEYEKYFLTCYDIVNFARSRDILCQGRGAAANSAVCYALGITAVDPDQIDILFARFVTKERREPPDIDIDFEHERREEVIQYIYHKYGRERAGLTATVITYRYRSAVRDVGKALGLSLQVVDRLAKTFHRWTAYQITAEDLRSEGLDPKDPTIEKTIILTKELLGFPRHLSQHVGGFVISQQPLSRTVPILNAAMEERTNIEWDKDDIEALGMLKIDLLGLGMLSCVRKALQYINQRRVVEKKSRVEFYTIPREDSRVYDMICEADTIGLFQIESRAQMSMLPRLRPRCFYDLVIEIAIVRPGPIRGNMVHPYLKRRHGMQEVTYPDDRVKHILGKTLGVPIFQEQAMQLAIALANFTPGEAEQLRRAMAAWKRNKGVIDSFRKRIVEGMGANGYSKEYAEVCVEQMRGFSEYGFPESHSASFALIAYASAWIKYYYPAEFAVALINSQPMGFYKPAQIISDARNHGVEVRAVDVNKSSWDLSLEKREGSDKYAVRLGMRLIRSLTQDQAELIIEQRNAGGDFSSISNLWHRTIQKRKRLRKATLKALARANAFQSLQLDRRQALWEIATLPDPVLPLDLLFLEESKEQTSLPEESKQLSIFNDYKNIGFSLAGHPISFIRDKLNELLVSPAITLKKKYKKPINSFVSVAGIVLVRQKPPTAKGFMFITIEDETAITNLVLKPPIFEKYKKIAITAQTLLAHGTLERSGDITYIIVSALERPYSNQYESGTSKMRVGG